MDFVGEGEGGKIWENGIETCRISCMKRDASPGSMRDAGCLGLVRWDDPEGWCGEGGGRRVFIREERKKKKKKEKPSSNKKKKSRDITLPTKVHQVKAMVFPLVKYRCESWAINKAECQRIDAFELWCWRRLLRVPCTERR